jgi:LuxR family maltose regulon positive regulatory protein
MEEPVLQTKLEIPIPRTVPAARPRAGLILRSQLVERLNEGLAGRLTLVYAQAGFGKTTLVSNWLQQADLPSARNK